MKVRAFPSGMLATNAYVVDDGHHRAAIIDPSPGCTAAVADWIEKQQLNVEKILLTHTHWDHIADCHELKEKYGVPVLVHERDADNLRTPGCDGLPMIDEIIGVEPDAFLVDGQMITIGATQWQVIHTPGHCPGSVCFYCEDEGVVISGDLIFRGGIGNLALPTAEPRKMVDSLARMAELPPRTVVYPGHGDATTIGEEVSLWEFL